jgi:Zn-dependent peptidase ImmA (M78 family)
MGSLGAITIPVPESGAPAALTVRLAFEVPDEAGEYRLRIIGFVPVRIWVPAASQESRRTP